MYHAIPVLRTNPIDISNEPTIITDEQLNATVFSDQVNIIGGSTYRLGKAAPDYFRRKQFNADVFTLYYLPNGLPIAIILDGASRDATNNSTQRIERFLAAEFSQLAAELSDQNFTNEQIATKAKQAFIKANEKTKFKVEFDASVALVIQFKNSKRELHYLALSCGDCMVLHDNGESVETIIAAKNDNNGDTFPPLTFGAQGMPDIYNERVNANLTIRIGDAPEDSRFLLLTDGAFESEELIERENNVDSLGKPIVITTLRAGVITPRMDIKTIAYQATQKVDSKIEENANCQAAGDDLMIAEVRVPTAEKQIELQNKFYEDALVELDITKKNIPSPTVLQKIDQIIAQADKIKMAEPEEIPVLIESLHRTNTLLKNPKTLESYKQFANELDGPPSIAKKILGGIIGSRVALAAIGAGFFYNGRCKGLSKSAHDLAEALEKNEPVILKSPS